jgi:hypothetical protein
MQAISKRTQFTAVTAGYVGVAIVAALLLYHRHMQYANYPNDVTASSGMYAFGDWILELFIVVLFLIPTFVLVLIIRNSEPAYTRYSQILLYLSVTAPVCFGIFLIPAVNQGKMLLGWICLDRLLVAPLVIVWLALSRVDCIA